MNSFDKRISDLIDQYNELDKEYISYLEADMNKEARKVNNKMQKIDEEIRKLQEQRDYGLKEDMKKTIDQYKKFITYKGLTLEFENYVEKEYEEEEDYLL